MAKKQFKAESKRLLDMMINSIYTHNEIFLRELISNASDAIDKLYYKKITENETGLSRDDFAIKIEIFAQIVPGEFHRGVLDHVAGDELALGLGQVEIGRAHV